VGGIILKRSVIHPLAFYYLPPTWIFSKMHIFFSQNKKPWTPVALSASWALISSL